MKNKVLRVFMSLAQCIYFCRYDDFIMEAEGIEPSAWSFPLGLNSLQTIFAPLSIS